MDNFVNCPACHAEVRPTDYFCYNCGKNLKPKPLSTSFGRQMIVYLESIFLPPYGILIGIRYLRQRENKSVIVGIVAIILTFLSLIIFVVMTRRLIDTVNTQVNNQLQFSGY